MGLFNAILGNASSIDIEDVVEQLEGILFPGEKVESAFRVIRDKWVFTDKRLIMIEVQHHNHPLNIQMLLISHL
mgnify:CR=1 FL=1